MKTTRVLLYSAGMDSFCARHLWKPDVSLYVDMHTRYSGAELSRLDDAVDVLDMPLGQWEHDNAIIPLRNLLLVCLAAQYGGNDGRVQIAMAATAGDRSRDKTDQFATQSSDLLSWLWSGEQWWTPGKRVDVLLPFKHFTKTELVTAYLAHGGDGVVLDGTLSCYNPDRLDRGCGKCKSCARRWVAMTVNGLTATPDASRYVVTELLPAILTGGSGRGSEDQDVLRALEMTSK